MRMSLLQRTPTLHRLAVSEIVVVVQVQFIILQTFLNVISILVNMKLTCEICFTSYIGMDQDFLSRYGDVATGNPCI